MSESVNSCSTRDQQLEVDRLDADIMYMISSVCCYFIVDTEYGLPTDGRS